MDFGFFDQMSHDMLNGNLDPHSMGQTYDASNHLLQTHTHFGNTVNHYQNGQLTGTDTLFGNTLQHHDAGHHFLGTSQHVGNTVHDFDASGHMIGSHMDMPDGSVRHFDQFGRYTGTTGSNGQLADAHGMLVNRYKSIF